MNQPDVDAAPPRRDPLELFTSGFRQFAPAICYAPFLAVNGEPKVARIQHGFRRGQNEHWARITVIPLEDLDDDAIIDVGVAAGQRAQLLLRVLDAGYANIQEARAAVTDPDRRRELFRFERNKT